MNRFITNNKMNPIIRQTIYNPAYIKATVELQPITEILEDTEANQKYIAEFTESLWKSQLFFEYVYFTLMPNIHMQNKYEVFFEQSSDKLLKLYIKIVHKIKKSKKLDGFKKEINDIYTKSNFEHYYTLSHFMQIFNENVALLHHVVGKSLQKIVYLLNDIIKKGYLNLTEHGKTLNPQYTSQVHNLYNKTLNPVFAPPPPTYSPPKPKPLVGKKTKTKAKTKAKTKRKQ